MSITFSSLPQALQELAHLKQWVCHKDKIPIDPTRRTNAKSNDPATWGDFATAYRAFQTGMYDGIGIEFGLYEAGTLQIAGIDLDHVVRSDGTLEPFAVKIVEKMNSYTEYSPSGTGLHILCRVKLPAIGNKKGLENGTAIEMYNNGRYFTVTGKMYGEAHGVCERTNEFKELHEKYFGRAKAEENFEVRPHVSDLTDRELLERIFSSSRGYEVRKLYSGDTSGYASHSEADLALVAHLLFWTGGDENRVDRMFRGSGLMRAKWDRADYRLRTLELGRRSQIGEYNPSEYGGIGSVFPKKPSGRKIETPLTRLSETTGKTKILPSE